MTMPRRGVLIGASVVVALIAVVAILFALDDGDGFTLVVADPASRAYVSVFLLIAGDAVIPIFPGETTLNAASTLAAQGSLSLPLVIIAGALGAIVGDSTLFWIARRNATASARNSSAHRAIRGWRGHLSSWATTPRFS